MSNKTGQRQAAHILMLEWKMICLRFGSQAAKNFIDIYAKLGLEKAFDYKHMLEKDAEDTERLQQMIDEVSRKLREILGKEDEHAILQ